jgi:hypothetical protein
MSRLVWGLLALLSLPLRAAEPPEVSVLTFQPGEIYWQRYGHNALLVREDGLARVYNYGIFDFQQRNFALNFARGRMTYRLAEERFEQTLWQYRQEGRGVLEQRLRLRPEQARRLADFLAWNARPENADYRYDYFTDNCSTKLRDALDAALDGALQAQLRGQPTGVSYRQEAARMMQGLPAVQLLTDALLGRGADQPIDRWQRSFLPEVLMTALREVTVDDLPLVLRERQWVENGAFSTPSTPPSRVLPMALAGLALAALLLLDLRARRRAWPGRALAVLVSLVFGLAGTVLALGWLFTDHVVMAANLHLLLLSPLSLLLLVPLSRPAPRTGALPWALLIVGLALMALLLQAWPGQPRDSLHWVLFGLPVHLALAARLRVRT